MVLLYKAVEVKFPSKKSNGHSVSQIDEKRSQTLSRSLAKLSQSKRQEELVLTQEKPVRRPFKLTIKKTASPAMDLSEAEPKNKRGLHNKGNSEHMRKIRLMRRIYRNKQLPVLQCNTCAYATSCPSYKAGYECAYLPFLNSHGIENETDVIGYLKELISAKIRRVHLATLMETMSGAAPSLELSESMQMAVESLFKLHERLQKGEKTELTFEGDTSVIGRLFGSFDNLLADTKHAQTEDMSKDLAALPPPLQHSNEIIEVESELIPGTDSNINHELAAEFEKDELDKDLQLTGKTTPSTSLVVSDLK